MEIFLIRHPSVAVADGICYGQKDVPLGGDHPREIEDLRRRLPDTARFRVYSSPLARCRIPAESLSFHEIVTDPDLLELNFGEWEGLSWDHLPVEQVHAWSEDILNIAPPGGEPGAGMLARCRRFWEGIVAKNQDCMILTHTGWIRMALAHLLDIPPQQAFRLHIDFCGVTKIEHRENWIQVMYVNR